MKNWLKNLAKRLPISIQQKIISILLLRPAVTPIAKRECNICHYVGYFRAIGRPLRLDARCPNCGSLERHRLLMLAVSRGEIESFANTNASVLHFAAEPILEKIFRKTFSHYTTADLFARADVVLNIESIDVDDETYDIVIANHVLEHVDDKKASAELSRILKPDGVLVCQVPIVEGWATTYENKSAISEKQRWLHFGRGNHLRFYGADFRQRICEEGFRLVKEPTSEGVDVVKHGLLRGEKVFIFQKT